MPRSFFKIPTSAELAMVHRALTTQATVLNGALGSTLHTNHPAILLDLELVHDLLRQVNDRMRAAGLDNLPLGLQDMVRRDEVQS